MTGRVRILLAAFVVTLGAAQGTAQPRAADVRCAPGVRQVAKDQDALGYRVRGDRCEGRYDYERFAASLRLAGFTESFADYPLDARRSLFAEWSQPAGVPAALEAVALAPRTYYRMDASPQESARSFRWPLDVLAGLGLERSAIGALAKAPLPVGGTIREVLLPLRIGVDQAAPRGKSFTLVLLSGAGLRKIFVTVFPIQPDGTRGSRLVQRELKAPFRYAGGEGIEIVLERPKNPGIYGLEIAAEPDSDRGDIDGLKAWFYND
jgi:hypothetical protein